MADVKRVLWELQTEDGTPLCFTRVEKDGTSVCSHAYTEERGREGLSAAKKRYPGAKLYRRTEFEPEFEEVL
jgi:hypothetical protein